uniref:SSD domain-containing protein n=1 Tax=Salvator merianae TaxID=96440 RepID=A0A8D0C637_SALMN
MTASSHPSQAPPLPPTTQNLLLSMGGSGKQLQRQSRQQQRVRGIAGSGRGSGGSEASTIPPPLPTTPPKLPHPPVSCLLPRGGKQMQPQSWLQLLPPTPKLPKREGRRATMPGCCSYHNDCVEKALSRALRGLGAWVGTNPWPFLLLPLALTSALSSGLVFISSGEGSDIEKQFTPVGSPAKASRAFVRQHFATDDSQRFSSHRSITEGTYAALIAVAAKDGDSVLTSKAFADVLRLDAAVRRIKADRLSYEELCARPFPGTNCSSPNPLIDAVGGDPNKIEAALPNITFPIHEGREFLGEYVGGHTLAPGIEFARPLRAAKAIHLLYFLQEDEPKRHRASTAWLEFFIERIPDVLRSLDLVAIRVKLHRESGYVEPIQKFLICCFGLLLLCGVPFIITAGSTPFLTLGVGVDDMFIMVSCWQQTQVKKSVRDRMADTYAEAAVSVTITSLSDILAFYIGIGSSFLSIQSFCVAESQLFLQVKKRICSVLFTYA